MKVALVQSCARQDPAANLDQVLALAEQAILAERPDLLVLPEVFALIASTPEQRRAVAEAIPDGPICKALADLARRHGITVHGGSLHERAEADRAYNTTPVFGPDGQLITRYRKIHLFDVTTPDGRDFRESATVAPGREVVSYRLGAWTVGCSICYDLRFPELYQALARQGCDLLVVPAAFTLMTGKDHWEVLLRARAIETACYVAAAAQWGRHDDSGRMSWGHSMVVDPWGHVIARASDGVGWTAARLDHGRVRQVRAQIPVHAHKVLP